GGFARPRAARQHRQGRPAGAARARPRDLRDSQGRGVVASLPLETLSEVLRRSPYHRLLGLEMVRASPGEVVIRMPFRGDLLAGDDEIGRYVHGGAIASLIDTAGGLALQRAGGSGIPDIA